ncbi:MAG: DUF1285 domain-containing protein [Oligoflexia bacterium]|nr:DUF1285 domain-containing protein [Oligoflexia bacterium]
MTEIRYTAYLEGHLRLSKTGEWWHEGRKFENQRLADHFSRAIVWDEQERRYFIQIGAQRASFDCEDTAYFVDALSVGESCWTAALSDGTSEQLDPTSLSIGAEHQIYCLVKARRHRARFSRAAHQVLLQQLGDDGLLIIGGSKIRLG